MPTRILATIIWGNVTTNVLLTLLSDSVLTGVAAFFFSAFAITMLGEIIPQAYFSRNALKMTSRFLPFLNFYRVVLYPLAKPTAMLLDSWLGPEGPAYMKERDIRSMLARHSGSDGTIANWKPPARRTSSISTTFRSATRANSSTSRASSACRCPISAACCRASRARPTIPSCARSTSPA